MAEINLSDGKGRDAVVAAESVTVPSHVRWVDESGAQAASRKVMRATMAYDLEALIDKYGEDLEKVAEALVAGDPEVDLEDFGQFLEDTSRVYVAPDQSIVHKVKLQEIVIGPDGEVQSRRDKVPAEPNVSSEIPLKWTGKKFKKSQIYNRFVFTGKVQIVHVNGLTYDFLYEMAKELEDEASMMRVGGGAKGADKLLFRRGGLEYFGFLEGRTDGKKYALILHLTNMELKKPKEPKEEADSKPNEEVKETPKEAPKAKAPAKKKPAKKKSTAKKKTTAKKAAKKKTPKK